MNHKSVAYVVATLTIGIVVVFLLSRLKFLWMKPVYMKSHNIFTFPFKTGDLILTCTRTEETIIEFPSSIIKMFTSSPYNHTGIIYVEPYTRQIYIWEMNGKGTRLASFYDMTCGNPNHYLIIRPLNKAIDVHLFEQILRRQWNYEFNLDFGLSWYNRYMPIVPFLHGYQWGKGKRQRTCAHMTTEMYDALGVIDLSGSGIDPSSVFPSDYAKEKIDTKIVPMANGYEFGSLIRLKFKPTLKNEFHIKDYSIR